MKTMKTKSALLMSVLSLVLCVAMLTSTTFAWFTDTAVSANNKIVSGTLKVDLELLKDSAWTSIKESKAPIFDYEKWEPGYTDVKILKVENEGTLALKWVAKFVSENQLTKLANVIDVYVLPSATELSVPASRDLTGYTRVGTVAEFVNSIEETTYGTLKAGEVAYLGIALKMQETAGNEYQELDLGGAFDIAIFATQETFEKDTFNDQYDKNADYDGEVSTLTALVAAAENGGNFKFVANIAAETPVAVPAGETVLFNLNGKTLEGSVVAGTGATLTIGNGTISNADSANSGIQSNGANLTINDATITSARHAVRIEGGTAVINGGTYKTVASPARATAMTQHALNVSDGATVTIIDGTFVGPKGTGADSGSAVNVQAGSTVIIEGGNFSGGLNKTLSAKGTLTIYGGTFDQDPSAYVADGYVANKNADGTWTVEERTADTWDGTADTSWYNDEATTFTLTTAEQFAGFAKLVDDGKTFEGKTVALGTDINLANILFNPIGSYRFDTSFKGTFDGQGYTISNLSQNTWELNNGYYYGDLGLGLFGAVEEGTVKNLVIDGAEVSGESAICGTIAAVAHNATFENITVKNANVADYQYYAGGIIGWASGEVNVIDCNLDASTNIAAQWGDFDNSIGGVIGGASGSAKILIKDTKVACRIDAYNDVTSSYQWYAYRRAGMLIGNTGKTETVDGTTVASAPQLTCENVTVIYDDWANYTYCEFAGTSWPYVRVQEGVSNSAYSNPRYGHPTDANGNKVVDDTHVHNDGEDHQICCVFDQLYGGGQGVYGTATHEGVTVVYNNK